MKKATVVFLICILVIGCKKPEFIEPEKTSEQGEKEVVHENSDKLSEELDEDAINKTNERANQEVLEYLINEEGMTIKERYPAPIGYARREPEENSFAEFLGNQKLKTYGEKVDYYDGNKKPSEGVYDSVFDVDIGNRDLHQCADAIMLLRAEYLYSQDRYDEISFNFVSGFKAEYSKWMEGYRIKVEGNSVSYYMATEPSNSYDDFRKYMTMVMAYASTLSLEKELEPMDIKNMEIGDVFIEGGSPGHAIIVVDMVSNEEGETLFLLAQSYMPAQQTQILINPMDEALSPWYSLKDKEELITPEWRFELDQLQSM